MTTDSAATPAAILVVGGTRGIGRAIALRVARPGLAVFLGFSSDTSAAAEAAAMLRERGASVRLVQADAGTPEGARTLAEAIERDTPHLDGLVYCAGLAGSGRLTELPLDTLRRTLDVGGLGLLYAVRAVLPLLGRGSSVVYLSGAAAELALPGAGARGTAKALGECLVRYLAIECAALGINFNTLRAGAVDTALLRQAQGERAAQAPPPDGRPLTGADVAEAAAFLLSPAAASIRGQTLRVDRGSSIIRSPAMSDTTDLRRIP